MASCHCLSDPYTTYKLHHNSLEKTENNVASSSVTTVNFLLSKGLPPFFLGRGDKPWFRVFSKCCFHVYVNRYTRGGPNNVQSILNFRNCSPYQISLRRVTLPQIFINYRLRLLMFLRAFTCTLNDKKQY